MFLEKIRLDISCELSPKQTIHMKCQVLFSQKNKINFRLLSATICVGLYVWSAIVIDNRLVIAEDLIIIFPVWTGRWLSWKRCPTGDQEVAGSTPAEVGNILSWRLIVKYFLRLFSPFHWFKKGSSQFLAKKCAQYWSTQWGHVEPGQFT